MVSEWWVRPFLLVRGDETRHYAPPSVWVSSFWWIPAQEVLISQVANNIRIKDEQRKVPRIVYSKMLWTIVSKGDSRAQFHILVVWLWVSPPKNHGGEEKYLPVVSRDRPLLLHCHSCNFPSGKSSRNWLHSETSKNCPCYLNRVLHQESSKNCIPHVCEPL